VFLSWETAIEIDNYGFEIFAIISPTWVRPPKSSLWMTTSPEQGDNMDTWIEMSCLRKILVLADGCGHDGTADGAYACHCVGKQCGGWAYRLYLPVVLRSYLDGGVGR
jgi:hypothetical protein